VDANSFKKIMNDFETEINNADRDLANLKNNGIEARKRVNQKATSYPIPLDKNINPGEAIQLLKQRGQEIQSTINIAKIDTSKPIAEIKKELKQTQSEIDSLKTIELHYKLLDEINLKQETQKLELEKLTELLINKTPLFEKCKKLIESLNQQIELFQKQKEDAIKIAELEELRNSLGSGDACPLCGSKEHPYLEHKPKIHKNEIDQKIATAKQELLKQKTESESLNKELTQCLTSKEHTQKQIDELSKQQANTDNEIKKYILEFNGQSDLEKKNIEHSINTLTKSNQAVEQAIEAVTEAQLNIELTDQYAALQKIIGNYKTLKKNRIEKFEGPDVNDVTNKLQDAFENSKSKITQLTAVIKKETDSLKRDSELVTSIGKDLKPKILELGFSDIKELSNNLLDEASLTKLTNRRDQLTRLKTSVETEVKTLKKELEQKLKLDKKPELSLESIID